MPNSDFRKMNIAGSSLHIFFVLLVIVFPNIITIFNEKEITIIKDLITEMEIRFIYILSNGEEIDDIKKISDMNVAAKQLDTYDFMIDLFSIPPYRQYLAVNNREDFRTAVIFKDKSLNPLNEIIKWIDQTEFISDKVRSFITVSILDDQL